MLNSACCLFKNDCFSDSFNHRDVNMGKLEMRYQLSTAEIRLYPWLLRTSEIGLFYAS